MQHQAVKLFYLSSKRRMEETNIITQPPIKPEIEALFNAGVHFAYKKTRRHPKLREYIAGVRRTVDVFPLERVYERLVGGVAFKEKPGTGVGGNSRDWNKPRRLLYYYRHGDS